MKSNQCSLLTPASATSFYVCSGSPDDRTVLIDAESVSGKCFNQNIASQSVTLYSPWTMHTFHPLRMAWFPGADLPALPVSPAFMNWKGVAVVYLSSIHELKGAVVVYLQASFKAHLPTVNLSSGKCRILLIFMLWVLKTVSDTIET